MLAACTKYRNIILYYYKNILIATQNIDKLAIIIFSSLVIEQLRIIIHSKN